MNSQYWKKRREQEEKEKTESKICAELGCNRKVAKNRLFCNGCDPSPLFRHTTHEKDSFEDHTSSKDVERAIFQEEHAE